MSRQTEKMMNELHAYIEKNGSGNLTEAEVNRLAQSFMEEYNSSLPSRKALTEKTAETADDFVELAEECEDRSDAMRFAKKALDLDPDNLDAERILAESGTTEITSLVNGMLRVVQHGDRLMKKQGYLEDDNIGHFWGITATRPYMRARDSYMSVLRECGMMKKAAHECEEMIRLCENDNLGVRYTLMSIYAFLENEDPALALATKYDGQKDSQMLLQLSVLYFKLGKWDDAEKHLKTLSRINKDTKKFFKAFKEGSFDRYMDNIRDTGGYRPGTIEELIISFSENSFLFESSPAFLSWAHDVLNKKR